MWIIKRSYILILILLTSNPSFCQIRSGAAFLKMLPGARLQAMASSHTGSIDDIHSIYANPGATGFIREWQWSASYTKWIADIYNASFLYGRRIRTPWSQNSRFGLGILYQGVPEFDSSDKLMPPATANDIVAGLNFGQPIKRNFSFGANLKYFQSTLDQYTANTWVGDIGFLAKTPKIGLSNSIFKYGIITAGIAVTQYGKGLVYESIKTPLPRTMRAGVSLHLGSHDGLHLQFTADYHDVKNEKGIVCLGTELSWSRRLAINAGVDIGHDLMNMASFGLSLQLDNTHMPSSVLAGRNNAFRIDLSTIDEEEFFSRTYRGTVIHQPVGPESFKFRYPVHSEQTEADSINLEWEKSQDPELFDEVNYTVLHNQDSVKLSKVLDLYHTNPGMFFNTLFDTTLVKAKDISRNTFSLKDLTSGDHYWAVMATDKNQHVRFAELNGKKIAHFFVPYPDIVVDNLTFEHSPWITEDDYQGKLKLRILNKGKAIANDFTVSVIDNFNNAVDETIESKTIKQLVVKQLHPGETKEYEFEWHTKDIGLHEIAIVADADTNVKEDNKENNRLEKEFFSIPKGKIATGDTVNALLVSKVSIDLPIITEICFDTNSTEIKTEYINRSTYDPPIMVLARRLAENPKLLLVLQGFSDPNSEKGSIQLSDARAEAVKKQLMELGASSEQIEIIPGSVLTRRNVPSNPLDARWVFEERRYVEINAKNDTQNLLFAPVQHIDKEYIERPMNFHAQIQSATGFEQTKMKYITPEFSDSTEWHQEDNINWENNDFQYQITSFSPERWKNSSMKYGFHIIDDHGREFKTYPDSVYLTSKVYQREHRIAFPLKFAQTDPLYSFYWARLFSQVQEMLDHSNMKMRFVGHACAIGPESVNNRLSERRAKRFHKDFISYLQNNHADKLAIIQKRMLSPEGYGESEPLGIDRLSGENILIGDNSMAIGRKLNRRIEIVFFNTENPLNN